MNEALIERLKISCLGLDAVDPLRLLVDDVIAELESQEPVAKPYAYEYGRCNADGTYSVVIEKGDLVQTSPAVYNYVRPQNAHKDWPIKELFDRPPQRTEQELVDYEKLAALGWQAIECGICGGGAMGYPQRTWVGLTVDELTDLFYNTNLGQASAVAQAIALLKEKNT